MRYAIIVVLMCLLASCVVYPGDEKTISAMGYDVADVTVFLSSIGADSQSFIASSSLRKQYERFRDGEVTQFMAQAKAKSDANSARSSGIAAGLATGMIISGSGK